MIEHKPDEKGTMQPEEFVEYLKPEFPAFIRLLAEYYIRLKNEHKSIIQISSESEAHKMGYIKEVESNLDRYVNACISFDVQSNVATKDAYDHYMSYYEFDESSVKRKEALSHTAFTQNILKNYKDKLSERNVCMLRDGVSKTVRCFIGIRLKSDNEIAEHQLAEGGTNHNDRLDDEGEPF